MKLSLFLKKGLLSLGMLIFSTVSIFCQEFQIKNKSGKTLNVKWIYDSNTWAALEAYEPGMISSFFKNGPVFYCSPDYLIAQGYDLTNLQAQTTGAIIFPDQALTQKTSRIDFFNQPKFTTAALKNVQDGDCTGEAYDHNFSKINQHRAKLKSNNGSTIFEAMSDLRKICRGMSEDQIFKHLTTDLPENIQTNINEKISKQDSLKELFQEQKKAFEEQLKKEKEEHKKNLKTEKEQFEKELLESNKETAEELKKGQQALDENKDELDKEHEAFLKEKAQSEKALAQREKDAEYKTKLAENKWKEAQERLEEVKELEAETTEKLRKKKQENEAKIKALETERDQAKQALAQRNDQAEQEKLDLEKKHADEKQALEKSLADQKDLAESEKKKLRQDLDAKHQQEELESKKTADKKLQEAQDKIKTLDDSVKKTNEESAAKIAALEKENAEKLADLQKNIAKKQAELDEEKKTKALQDKKLKDAEAESAALKQKQEEERNSAKNKLIATLSALTITGLFSASIIVRSLRTRLANKDIIKSEPVEQTSPKDQAPSKKGKLSKAKL